MIIHLVFTQNFMIYPSLTIQDLQPNVNIFNGKQKMGL